MKRYRFFDIDSKWFLMPPTIDGPNEFCPDKHTAGLFTEADWQAWGRWEYGREEIGEDEMMRLVGAPMLPGLDV